MDPKRMRMDPAGGASRATELTMNTVVSIGEIGRPLDPVAMEKHFRQIEKKQSGTTEVRFKERFQGLTLTKKTPEGTLNGIVFSTGKIVCTGAKTEASARNAALGMLKVVKQIMYPGRPESALPPSEAPKIQSYIASFEVGFEIQLEHLALEKEADVVYEPEIYPNLIYKIKQPKVQAFISPKGKVLFIATYQDHLSEARKVIVPILEQFRRSKYGSRRS